jgi:cytoskeletal protein CcmA (bactofilin family)
MNAGEGTTMIGKSVKIVGDLSGSEDLVMDGELHGTIRLPGARLTIGPAARVRGDISAKDIVVFGRLDGDIRAVGRVELRASALVQGNIFAGSLSMEENAAFRGQVDPSRAGEPIPERPAAASQPSAPASNVPAEGPSVSIARSPAQLPAAVAAAAAPLTAAIEPAHGDNKDAGKAAPLFAEAEA